MFRTLVIGASAAAAILALGAEVQAQRRPQIVLFQEDNFRGNQLALDGPAARLGEQHFDDRASSVKVLSGAWQLCQEDNFGGRCVTVDRDMAKLDSIRMDDRISSVRPADAGRDDRRRR